MYTHPAGSQQPQLPPSNGRYQSGPSPAKKQRGNGPIITRYPPPPGYRGPAAQPQAPFSQQTVFAYGQQPWVGYPQPFYPQSQGYVSQQYYAAAQPGWYPQMTAPQSAPPITWQHPPPPPVGLPRHNSAPQQSYHELLDGNGDPMPPMDSVADGGHELEEDFDSECYFARYPEEIDPTLSLGLIEWKAPLPTKRALPCTFNEAELEALAPRVPQASDDESVSDFFKIAKREESLLSVRQTDVWHEIKDNLIFKEFASVCSSLISLTDMIALYRNRYDAEWAQGDRRSPTPSLTRDSTPANDDHMDVEVHGGAASAQPSTRVSDNFESALRSRSRDPTHRRQHSRTNSICSASSHHTGKLTRPVPLPPVRDETQEDILAALGVTGSPKLVYQTPGPAYGPSVVSPKKQNSRTNSISSTNGSLQPPIQRPAPQHDDDAEPDDQATPRPKLKQHDTSRKRSYADSVAGAIEECESEHEATPKQRRKQARVDGKG